MRGITKRFGQVAANDDINLELYCGEILALLGENGSGKTTLMNMLSGIYQPDSGEIYENGERIYIRSPHDAFLHGIGMIHQHYKLIEVFTAAQNIILGLDEEKMDLAKTNVRVKEICDRYGFEIDPARKVYDMSVSQKQTIEIVKVLYRGAEILILDEPTAVLTPQETQKLFNVLRNMKEDGKAIIIITHKLNEVMEVSDRVAVLRKGRYVGCVDTKDTDPQALTDMMVGHSVSLNIDRPRYEHPEKRLIVENLTCIFHLIESYSSHCNLLSADCTFHETESRTADSFCTDRFHHQSCPINTMRAVALVHDLLIIQCLSKILNFSVVCFDDHVVVNTLFCHLVYLRFIK